jgi:hypothetical protein
MNNTVDLAIDFRTAQGQDVVAELYQMRTHGRTDKSGRAKDKN